ncbi:MAG: TIGR00730 family Rossman fold protein [Rhodoblastus sp.]
MERVLLNICVYCGSANGAEPHFAATAEELGKRIGAAGHGLVYGGGDNGLMGKVARATLEAGGRVTGIIPEFLRKREAMLHAAQELVVVPDMHTRKRIMFERSDAFVALPGGVGTLEELVEQLTWVQLGRHTKPVVIADVGGFWRPLLSLFAHMRSSGFIRQEFELRYLVAERTADILPMIESALALRDKSGGRIETVDPRL